MCSLSSCRFSRIAFEASGGAIIRNPVCIFRRCFGSSHAQLEPIASFRHCNGHTAVLRSSRSCRSKIRKQEQEQPDTNYLYLVYRVSLLTACASLRIATYSSTALVAEPCVRVSRKPPPYSTTRPNTLTHFIPDILNKISLWYHTYHCTGLESCMVAEH